MIRPNTQSGRLLRVLADGRWHGGPTEFGNDFHVASQRIMGDLKRAGFPCVSRKRKGENWQEYRLDGNVVVCAVRAHIAMHWDDYRMPPVGWSGLLRPGEMEASDVP